MKVTRSPTTAVLFWLRCQIHSASVADFTSSTPMPKDGSLPHHIMDFQLHWLYIKHIAGDSGDAVSPKRAHQACNCRGQKSPCIS